MKLNKLVLFMVFFSLMLLQSSCSKRFRNYRKIVKKYLNKEITRTQYDSLMIPFYTFQLEENQVDIRLNGKGSYICADFDEVFTKDSNYRSIRIIDNNFLIKSVRINNKINNKLLGASEGVKLRYKIVENELLIEYLLAKDFELYNVYNFAKINDKELIFYKRYNLQLKETELIEPPDRFYYIDSLVTIPKIPH